jgi:hypothetical protein
MTILLTAIDSIAYSSGPRNNVIIIMFLVVIFFVIIYYSGCQDD